MSEAIEITCEHCDAEYSVSADLAGHRVRCARCGHAFELGADLGGGGEGRIWRFRMPGGQKFGPLSKPELDEYLHEGILTAECQVHRGGEDRWRWAGEVYPEVPEFQSKASRTAGEVEAKRGGIACAGLLERIPNIRTKLPSEHRRSHDLLDAQLQAEARESADAPRILGSRSLGLVQSVAFGRQFTENFGASLPGRRNVNVNSLAVVGFARDVDEFYLVAPFCGLERQPHEFFAVLEGRFPTQIALVAGASGPRWSGLGRGWSNAGAAAMKAMRCELGEGAQWKWSSKDRKDKRSLEWVIQLIPLGSEQFMLIAQTASLGRRSKRIGIDWFAEQIQLAKKLRTEFSVPGNSEARFPLHSESAELLARMFFDT